MRSDSLPAGLALLCRARTRLCAVPLAQVVETLRPLPVMALAGAPPFVAGLSIIRGAPVPVVDVGALLPGSEPPRPTRFVLLRLEERRVALALEGVLGVEELPGTLQSLPALLAGASAAAVAAVGTLDAELLLVLEAARAVPESVWRELDAERGR
jgi:purine-binding chemotaxis protein CheW